MRQHQSMAVKSMFAVTDNKRLNSLLTDVLSKMKKVLEKSKKVVEEAKFTPSNEVRQILEKSVGMFKTFSKFASNFYVSSSSFFSGLSD